MKRKKRLPRRWCHSRWDNYWYWEDDQYGYGHVVRYQYEGGRVFWSATALTPGRHKTCKTLRDAKRFVERYA